MKKMVTKGLKNTMRTKNTSLGATCSESEAKILYFEGDELRVFRGTIVAEDDLFISIRRRDGIVRIAKSHVVKIDERSSENDVIEKDS